MASPGRRAETRQRRADSSSFPDLPEAVTEGDDRDRQKAHSKNTMLNAEFRQWIGRDGNACFVTAYGRYFPENHLSGKPKMGQCFTG